MKAYYDICVAGGGPAGITTGVKLHRLGYQVLIIASGNPSNRPNLQSISPGVLTLIDAIGLDAEKIRHCLRPIRNTRKYWNSVEEEISQPPGFLVHRHIFDDELLKAARNIGVHVVRPAALSYYCFADKIWELKLSDGQVFSANFLVDATGKKSLLRTTKIRIGLQTIAVTGSWKNSEHSSLNTLLESSPENWFWGAKLSDNLFQATVFTNLSSIVGKSMLMEHYLNAIRSTNLFRNCLHSSLNGKLTTIDVTPYFYKNPICSNFIKVGEAALGIDPISSQGVQTAMANSIQGAIAINTIMKYPEQLNMVKEFYSSHLQDIIKSHLSNVSKTYSSSTHLQINPGIRVKSDHWDKSTQIRTSEKVRWKLMACIEGDLITSKMALVHPGLPFPMVYWQNLAMEKVIDTISSNQTVSNLLNSWTHLMQSASALELLTVLREAGVIDEWLPVIS